MRLFRLNVLSSDFCEVGTCRAGKGKRETYPFPPLKGWHQKHFQEAMRCYLLTSCFHIVSILISACIIGLHKPMGADVTPRAPTVNLRLLAKGKTQETTKQTNTLCILTNAVIYRTLLNFVEVSKKSQVINITYYHKSHYEFILRCLHVGRSTNQESQESPVSTLSKPLPESVSFVSMVGSWTFGAKVEKGAQDPRSRPWRTVWLITNCITVGWLVSMGITVENKCSHQQSIWYLDINQP